MLKKIFTLAFILFFCTLCEQAWAETSKSIAYFERGNFWLFNKSYKALQIALKEQAVPCLYPKELHISPGWQASQEEMDSIAKKLLASNAHVIIAAGSSATSTLLRHTKGEKLIIGIALADPLASGFMDEKGFSKYPSFVTEVFPGRWESMYRVFHSVIDFKKLGIMYPAGLEGKIYAALDDAHVVAKERNFSIVEAIIPDESPESCLQGIEELHKKGADSFFISPLVCFDITEHDPSDLLKRIHTYGMPTFARDGASFVQAGALMGFSTWDFEGSAMRMAKAIATTLKGEELNRNNLIVISEPTIALNLQVAKELDFVFPFDLLLSADQIYEKTSIPLME